MSDSIFRIHPAIGIARVGNSSEYYLAPETAAALNPDKDGLTGGLPINPNTGQTITSSDIRDANGNFKRQAARFKIYQYPAKPIDTYPSGDCEGVEITIGSKVGDKTVTDIRWTVHVANKKANCYVLVETPPLAVLASYENGQFPPLRNLAKGTDPSEASRLTKLVIDPGPRAIQGTDSGPVEFDKATTPSYWDGGNTPVSLDNYPSSYPQDHFADLYQPAGQIDTLGELQTDDHGRLIVTGGYGRAVSWILEDGSPYPLKDDVNNDGWFDDTSDGPVNATLVYDDNTTDVVVAAWVATTDPSYAPQTLNVVSLWDDIYNSWVQDLNLRPDIWENGAFNASYIPNFKDDLHPIFTAAGVQQWTTNLPASFYMPGHDPHAHIANIQATDAPGNTALGSTPLRNIRAPGNESAGAGTPLMPLSLGDANKSFLAVSETQHFFLQQWVQNWSTIKDNNQYTNNSLTLGPGEMLDKVTLQNCLGGRFSPGIDLTFIMRQPDLYIKNWQTAGTGPFRVNPAVLDYSTLTNPQSSGDIVGPFLTAGYFPLHNVPLSASFQPGIKPLGYAEPGDVSKFLALPWHTDYNSCSLHIPSPNPVGNTTLYWSWPAQRPVAVFPAELVKKNNNVLWKNVGTEKSPAYQTVGQRFSVRSEEAATLDASNLGAFVNPLNMVKHWYKLGVVIQAPAIDNLDFKFNSDYYLEVESLLPPDSGNIVKPWPVLTTDTPETYPDD